MKVGDLVRYKYYPEEGGIVIQHYAGFGVETIDILSHTGVVLLRRNPDAFEVVGEG